MVLTGLLGLTSVRVAGLGALAALALGAILHPRTAPAGYRRIDPLVQMGLGMAMLSLISPSLTHAMSWWGLVLILSAYIPLTCGALDLFSARVQGRRADVLLESCLTCVAVALALWVTASRASHALTPALAARVAVPALDAALCLIVAQLLLLPGERIASYRYLLLALTYLLGAHLGAGFAVVAPMARLKTIIDVLLVAALAFFGAASLDRSAQLVTDPTLEDPPPLSMVHVALVTLAIVVGPALVVTETSRGVRVSFTTGVTVMVVALMLAAYTAHLLLERAGREHRVNHDDLTGLPNRTLLVDRIGRALGHARRSSTEVALMFVDLDEFKAVNDTFGHEAGDALLRLVSDRLRGCLRDEDTVARLGGDEFVLLLPHIEGVDAAITVAQRVKLSFAEPFRVGEERFAMTASIGVSLYPHDGETPESILAAADSAMYRVKAAGRNDYEIFSVELSNHAHERLAVESGIRAAIEDGQLVLHYQPTVDIATGEITGAEALVRWNHPERGIVGPDDFIPVAERSDLIVAIGDWVLAESCEQVARWREAGLTNLTVAVNVSARQLRHRLADRVSTVLRATGIDPSTLVLELTESVAAGDLDLVAVTLSEVRSMGVRWSIDDFGTGYCSLTYLSRLPVDNLKIDRSFIQGGTDADRTIVSAITALGHSLGMTIIAEGVEEQRHLDRLRALGCEKAQGYLFSRPVAPEAFEALVRAQRSERIAEGDWRQGTSLLLGNS